MLIKSIRLSNFRLYRGKNEISFSFDKDKNIYLIAGENGFGKTTFLLSLLWCLYGKQMAEIDDTVKKDLLSSGNYSTFLLNNLNLKCRENLERIATPDIIKSIQKQGYSFDTEYISDYSQYSVSVTFSEVYIPSIPCHSVEIIRTFDCIRQEETTTILIDGAKNELSVEIGVDVFINDFILNKDIARFFFFDSEKIVSLAEINTVSEKRKLSSAYNEVLGVKKYEDLKKNLENLRIRLRKKSSDIESRNKLNTMLDKQTFFQDSLYETDEKIKFLDEEIIELKRSDDELQLQLLREGNSMTLEGLKSQQKLLETVQQKDSEYKAKLREMLDYVPFAIAGEAFVKAKKQVDKESLILKNIVDVKAHNEVLNTLSKELLNKIKEVKLTITQEEHLNSLIQQSIQNFYKEEKMQCDKGLLSMTKEQCIDFQAIYSNLISTFKIEFERLTDDYRKNRQVMERTLRRIASANADENNSHIKDIREQKNRVEQSIVQKEQEIRMLYEKNGSINRELNVLSRKIAELSKTVSLDDSDAKKDKIAERLIIELNTFLISLKKEKKSSLEKRIRQTLNGLMHKEDFIDQVHVEIVDDLIDINLFDKMGNLINKEVLSKGEQQLYATSILKSLVDESGIEFPVFIDSPLQKFDKRHAQKIISEFYPAVSRQVVLFPLLEKELTAEEYRYMKSKVQAVYFIKNVNGSSCFELVKPDKLFKN